MKKQVNLPQQMLLLKSKFGSVGSGYIFQHKELLWNQKIKPSVLSRVYEVRIKYILKKYPNVFVIEPDLLELAKGRQLPHVYTDPLQLCLFTPELNQWEPTMHLSTTIVPWTYAWLYYFEEWLESNEWKGGGTEHGVKIPESIHNSE